MTQINLSISSIKKRINYIFAFIITLFFTFFLLIFFFSNIDKNIRDSYLTEIHIEQIKNDQFHKTNDLIISILEDFKISDQYFRKNIIRLSEASSSNKSFEINYDYDNFFINTARTIYIDILRNYEVNKLIDKLSIIPDAADNSKLNFNTNFVRISFMSKNKISDKILSEINIIVNNNLNTMMRRIITRLNYYQERNIRYNQFLKKFEMDKVKELYLGDLFNKQNEDKILILESNSILKNIEPKIFSDVQYIDFKNPLEYMYLIASIFSFLITVVVFYIIFILKNLIRFK